MSKHLAHALSVLLLLATVLPGCAGGEENYVFEEVTVRGRGVGPGDFRSWEDLAGSSGGGIEATTTVCCDDLMVSEPVLRITLEPVSEYVHAAVVDASPGLSFTRDGEPQETEIQFDFEEKRSAVVEVRVTTCDFSRATFKIKGFQLFPNFSYDELFLTFEIVNECANLPPPVGPTLEGLPDYLTAMKFRSASTGTDDFQLYGFNADGADEGRVTDNAFRDRAPEWSPDGTRLAFVSNRGGTSQDSYDLYIAEGTVENVQRVTDFGTSGGAAPRRNAWSPDGTRICFVAGRDLYVVEAAPGKTPVQVTQGPEDDDQPTWSQDSSRIAFVRDLALWIMDADGGNAQQVLDDVFRAAWSPAAADGRRIAVMRGQGLFILEPDDSLTPWGDNTAAIGDTLLWTEDGIVSLYGGELTIVGETSTEVIDLDIDPEAETEGLTRR